MRWLGELLLVSAALVAAYVFLGVLPAPVSPLAHPEESTLAPTSCAPANAPLDAAREANLTLSRGLGSSNAWANFTLPTASERGTLHATAFWNATTLGEPARLTLRDANGTVLGDATGPSPLRATVVGLDPSVRTVAAELTTSSPTAGGALVHLVLTLDAPTRAACG